MTSYLATYGEAIESDEEQELPKSPIGQYPP